MVDYPTKGIIFMLQLLGRGPVIRKLLECVIDKMDMMKKVIM